MDTERSLLQILRSESLPKAVQAEIMRLILEGEVGPGDKLTEADLAARLQVSRGPVREAFRALEEAGLLRLTRNRGVFVRQMDREQATELYEVRAGLDEMVGRILAPRITAEQVAELREFIKEMDTASSRNDPDGYFPRNIRFHDRIVEMTGNTKLLEIYRRLMNEMHLMRRRSLFQGGGILVSNEEHSEMVEALASGDPEKASRMLREHVMRGQARLLPLLNETVPVVA